MMKVKMGIVSLAVTVSTTCISMTSIAQESSKMTYEVPRSDLLQEPLIVDLQKAKLHIDGNQATLDYRLPKELDGNQPKRFRLLGSYDGQSWNLSTNEQSNANGDPSAKASCQGTDKNFECVMNYGRNDAGEFPLDTESADRYLQSRPDLSPEQIIHIKQAQSALSHEPIGIIRVRRK